MKSDQNSKKTVDLTKIRDRLEKLKDLQKLVFYAINVYNEVRLTFEALLER